MSGASPFSLRLSDEERAILLARTKGRPLGEYIRHQLFGDQVSPRKLHQRKAGADAQAIARLLASLGKSRLASNMNQIAKAANIGALPVGPDLTQELFSACRDIADMRRTLISSLGIKS